MGLVFITNIKVQINPGGIGPTLGFITLVHTPVIGTVIGEAFPKLIIYKEVFFHLQGLSTAENRFSQLPSTWLHAIPMKEEGCNSSCVEALFPPQVKHLETGMLSSINISVLDKYNKLVKLEHFNCVLELWQNCK